MGGHQSILRDVEAGEALPEDTQLYRAWTTIFPGRYKEQLSVSVFVREFTETDTDETREFFHNGIQTLKQLRHPAILSYCTSWSDNNQTILVTERCRPLDLQLENVEAVEILSGLCHILEGIIFLQDRAGLCHNNVSLASIFVSKQGMWKLGGFECALKSDKNGHWVVSDFAKTVKDGVFVPPEDEQLMKKEVPPHARDSYGFGKLVEYLIPYMETTLSEHQLTALNELIQTLTNEDAAQRPKLATVRNAPGLWNELTDVTDFLQNIPVKTTDDKDAFFRSLIPRLKTLPPHVVARRLAQLLLSRYVLLEPVAVESFLPQFLCVDPGEIEKPTDDTEDDEGLESYPKSQNSVGDGCTDVEPFLSLHLFRRYCAPELLKIFCVHESAVRLALLSHFPKFAHSFDISTLENVILPELLLGMKDTDENIVAVSMRCLADLVPILGAATVTGLSHRKYFAEGRPRAIGKVPTMAQLQNVKVALQNDPDTVRNYDQEEEKQQRRIKAEERRRQMEEKRLERKKQLLQKDNKAKSSFHSKDEKANETTVSSDVLSFAEDIEGKKNMEPDLAIPVTKTFDVSGVGNMSNQATSEVAYGEQELEECSNKCLTDRGRNSPENDEDDEDWRDWDEPEEITPPHAVSTQTAVSPTTPKPAPKGVTSTVLKPILAVSSELRKQNEIPGPSKQVMPKVVQPLGAEFDVLALDLSEVSTQLEQEPDFFADMEPDFGKKEAVPSKTLPAAVNMFQMAITDDIDTSTSWDLGD